MRQVDEILEYSEMYDCDGTGLLINNTMDPNITMHIDFSDLIVGRFEILTEDRFLAVLRSSERPNNIARYLDYVYCLTRNRKGEDG